MDVARQIPATHVSQDRLVRLVDGLSAVAIQRLRISGGVYLWFIR